MDCVQEEEDQADESFWWDSFWNQMLHDVPEEEMEEQELRGEQSIRVRCVCCAKNLYRQPEDLLTAALLLLLLCH